MTGEVQFEEKMQKDELQSIICRNTCDQTDTFWQRLLRQPTVNQGVASLDDSLRQACFGASHIFAKALSLGRIRGIVGIFSQQEEPPQNQEYAKLINELLQRDILVLSFGLAAAAIQKLGITADETVEPAGEGLTDFCTNLDIPPVLVMGNSNNPEHFEEFCNLVSDQTGIDAGDLPFAALEFAATDTSTLITAYNVQGLIISSAENKSAAQADHVDSHIHEKRLAIDWCDRYHCTLFS